MIVQIFNGSEKGVRCDSKSARFDFEIVLYDTEILPFDFEIARYDVEIVHYDPEHTVHCDLRLLHFSWSSKQPLAISFLILTISYAAQGFGSSS
jgi:hypothetical protein